MKDNKMIKEYEYVIERTDIVDNVIFLSEYVVVYFEKFQIRGPSCIW
jgi:hypothetical protein